MAGSGDQKRFGFEGLQPFDAHTQAYWTKAGEAFRELLREGVHASGDKQGASIAQDVNVAPTQFSEALHGKNNRHFSALWIPRTSYADPQCRALEFLASLSGRRTVPDLKLSDKQIATALIEALLSNADAGRAILLKAFGSKADAVVRTVAGDAA